MTTPIQTRTTQQTFAYSVLGSQTGQFGSLNPGPPAYAGTVAQVQTAAYAHGWANAVVNNNAPALEDLNGLFYSDSAQLAYLFQAGIAEWDSATTYVAGSVVCDTQSGGGNQIFQSLSTNTGNVPHSDATHWSPLVQAGTQAVTGPTTTCNAQLGAVFNVAAGAGGNKTFTISNLIDGQTINVLVAGAAANTVTWTIAGLTQKTGVTYSNTMTSTYSMFTITRVGTFAIINALHGIS